VPDAPKALTRAFPLPAAKRSETSDDRFTGVSFEQETLEGNA
jgi:hypothetical protein